MSQSNDSSFVKGFVFGAFIGGAVGAVTALLLAPKTGAELRKDLAEKGKETFEKAQTIIAGVENVVEKEVEVISNTVNEGKLRAQGVISTAKQQADELLESADIALKEARFKASQAKDIVSKKIDNVKDAAKAGVDAFKTELNSNNDDYFTGV